MCDACPSLQTMSRSQDPERIGYVRNYWTSATGTVYSYLIADASRASRRDRRLDGGGIRGAMPAPCADLYRGCDFPPVLAVHGLGFNATYWLCLMARLYPKCTVIAVDLPNSGQSGTAAALSVASLAADLDAFMQSLLYTQYTVVGQGLGGLVALQMAASYTERVERVVVCSTNPQPLPDADPTYEFPFNVVLLRLLATVPTLPASEICRTARTLASVLDNDDIIEVASLADQYANSLAQFQAYLGVLSGVNLRPILGDITAPVLIVAGTDDLSVPMGASGVLREGIANSALVEIYGAGNNVPIRRTTQFNDAVYNFLFVRQDLCQAGLIINNALNRVCCPPTESTACGLIPEYYCQEACASYRADCPRVAACAAPCLPEEEVCAPCSQAPVTPARRAIAPRYVR